MNAPQIVMIILLTLGFSAHAIKHGQPRETTYDVRWQLFSIAIIVGILYWGGFWS